MKLGMQIWMRRFSIRWRMLAAIGVVLSLLGLVGGAGLWGMQQTEVLTQRFVDQAFQNTLELSRLRLALADTSRFEKDMVIQYESPEQMSLANMHWERSQKEVAKHLETLLTRAEGGVLPLLQNMQKNLGTYAEAVEPVVRQIQAGEFASATFANRRLEKAHERYSLLLKDMKQVEEHIVSRAEALREATESTQEKTILWFGVALAIAVLVVVPTTLANMNSICRPLDEAQ